MNYTKKNMFNYTKTSHTRKNRMMTKGWFRMREKIIKFEKSYRPEKKYMVFVKNLDANKIRVIHFGASDYEQYKDRTPLKLYSHKNHNNRKRMQNYFNRHSGTKKRGSAIALEKKKSQGYYNAKILSHVYLW